jgi:hypothetical protein
MKTSLFTAYGAGGGGGGAGAPGGVGGAPGRVGAQLAKNAMHNMAIIIFFIIHDFFNSTGQTGYPYI